MTNSYVAIMIATSRKLPSTLETSSLDASKRPTTCTSSLPLGRDPSSSQKLSAHQHIDSSGATGKEYPTPGMWSIYVDYIRRIVLNLSYVFPFLYPSFSDQINKYFKQSSAMSRALPPPSSYSKFPRPLDMLGGLAKANVWVAKPGGSESLLFLPLDMLGGLAQSQTKGHPDLRTPSLTKYEASCRYEHAWSERSPDLSPRLLPRAPTYHKPPR
jgi:hypothetical protein